MVVWNVLEPDGLLWLLSFSPITQVDKLHFTNIISFVTFPSKITKHDYGHFSNFAKFQSNLTCDGLKFSVFRGFGWKIVFVWIGCSWFKHIGNSLNCSIPASFLSNSSQPYCSISYLLFNCYSIDWEQNEER